MAQNSSSKKPKNIEEIEAFVFKQLKDMYGDSVISEKPNRQIVIDTGTKHDGNSDVWIGFSYFH